MTQSPVNTREPQVPYNVVVGLRVLIAFQLPGIISPLLTTWLAHPRFFKWSIPAPPWVNILLLLGGNILVT